MKRPVLLSKIGRFFGAAIFTGLILLAGVPAATADTVPKGLAASDWKSIRAAHEADQRHEAPRATRASLNPVAAGAIAQEAYAKASNTDAGDQFGYAVAISGNTVVVGAIGESSNATGANGDQTDNSLQGSGAAYIFVRNGATWTQQAYLKASNTAGGMVFGFSVAISGNTVVIGAIGENSKATGVNGDQTDNSAPSAGAAYVFVRKGTTWSQQAYLKASNTDPFDFFGYSVAVSGNTAVVSARHESSAAVGINGDQANNAVLQSGAAYVFVRTGVTWKQQAYLKASNTDAGDEFGYAVAISGDTAVIGADFEASKSSGIDGDQADNNAAKAGAAYVFAQTGVTWAQQAYLKASNTDADDKFGYAVAVSGDTVLVGAVSESSMATGINGDQADNSEYGAGAAYVYVRDGTSWEQQAYLKASNTDAADFFAASVALFGDTAIVGAMTESSMATGIDGDQTDNSAWGAGAAYVFLRSGGAWSQQAYLKASNATTFTLFGYSVGIAGDTAVVGSEFELSKSTGINGDESDQTAIDSGAAYFFAGLGPTTLGNLSTRLLVETDDNALIGGFIISGTQPKKVIVRAIGPSLLLFGALADPMLELHDGTGTLIASNDNWMDALNKQAIIDSTIAPTSDLESAILLTLDPGPYTAIVRGVDNAFGTALVEAYDLDRTVDSKLANISTRGLVQTGDDVIIGGFILLGTAPQEVIVRALGPSLPVAEALADPMLELHDSDGALLAANDDWRDTQEAEIIATNVPPNDDAEAAIVATLAPAAYTAIARGVNDTTGVALVEVYALAPLVP